jgi:Leucine-rich repeat (LRR) protein
MERVTMFNASHNPLGAGVRSLVRAPRLRVLELANCGLESHAAQLARAELPSLVSLDVSDNGVTVEVTTAFACANLPALESLDLRMNGLGFPGVAPFEAITGLPALRRLGLGQNQLSSGKTETVEGGDEWNPWSTTRDIELTPVEIIERLKLRAGISVF